MKNSLEERDDTLATVDYTALLKDILAVVKTQASAFQAEKTCLRLDLDAIALAVAHKAKAMNPPFTNIFGTTHATVNFEDLKVNHTFNKQIEDVRGLVRSHLEKTIEKMQQGLSLEDYVASLIAEATAFQGDTPDHFNYPFNEIKLLSKRRLHLRSQKAGGADDARLKGHKLTIVVKGLRDFESELIDGLCNKMEEVCNCTPKVLEVTREVLKRRLDDSSSELSILRRVLHKESLGRLQKEAKVRYLEFLLAGMEQWKNKEEEAQGLNYLRTLVRRLRLLEAFINDETKDDAEYQVSYSGCSANYRDLFARADAYDMLPIIAEVEGSLGETTNKEKGEQIFIAGLKLKLNGHVQSYASVFDYYVTMLDSTDKTHQEQISEAHSGRQRFAEKVLKLALLYYFVFKNMEDAAYDPRTEVVKDIIGYLQSGDEKREKNILRWLKNGLTLPKKELKNLSSAVHGLTVLKNTLEAFVKVPHIGPDAETYTLHLVVENGLLDETPSRMQMEKEFFRTDALQDSGRAALKYISVQDANADESGFCTLPVSLQIEPMYYFSSAQESIRQFRMRYEVNGYQMLPTIFVPSDEKSKKICDDYYKSYERVVLFYSSRLPFKYDTPEAFAYRFTLLLLSYLCVKLLCDSVKPLLVEQHKRLFIPLVRIHKNKKTEKEDQLNEEGTISTLSKVVSHMLAGEYFSNAQGFHIDVLAVQGKNYKLINGLSSLYTALPKVFGLDHPPALDKLAVILVSSRKSDAHIASDHHIASIYGEVIGIRRNSRGSVRIETLRTFSDYEASHKMYRSPITIRDQVRQCYDEGYKHILYIAQAPYSSMLHMTGEEENEQFFMSKEVIQVLTDGNDDLNVYPLYCDKYYVVKVGNAKPNAESLYVDDMSELRTLFADPNRSSIVFFNLFNGYTLPDNNTTKRTYYNGVLSYATLVNVYDNPLHDQAIRNNLLDGKQTGALKDDFLDFLTLLHFSRYEKSERNITFKLEPYQNIIGSESVGTLSILQHNTIRGVRFNALAFLTAVRKALNKQYIGYKPLPSEDEQSSEERES